MASRYLNLSWELWPKDRLISNQFSSRFFHTDSIYPFISKISLLA
jgi:hypothetical protein